MVQGIYDQKAGFDEFENCTPKASGRYGDEVRYRNTWAGLVKSKTPMPLESKIKFEILATKSLSTYINVSPNVDEEVYSPSLRKTQYCKIICDF